MPTPLRSSRSGGTSPSGTSLVSPLGSPLGGRRVSPRDRGRSGDKDGFIIHRTSPVPRRSPLTEIFASPETGGVRGGGGGGPHPESNPGGESVSDDSGTDDDDDDDDAMEGIMATQGAPSKEEETPTVYSPTFDLQKTTTSDDLVDPTDPTLVATRRLSERVFQYTGKRLSNSWSAKYEESTSSGGKRKRLWFVSPNGKRFDGPGKVAKYIGERASDADVTDVAETETPRRRLNAHSLPGPEDGAGRSMIEPIVMDGAVESDAVQPTPVTKQTPATATKHRTSVGAKETTPSVAAKKHPTPSVDPKDPTPAKEPTPTKETPKEPTKATPLPTRPVHPVAAPIVDRRAGDAAARHLRRRLLQCTGSGAPPRHALHFCPELAGHQQHLVEILGDTVRGEQNNSVLLVGACGSGKTTVLDSALNELIEKHGAEKTLVVRLNGMLHSDEKVGMREIANQLCAAGDELLFSRTAGFMENIGFMREVLRILEQGGRAVIFVLEAFDLFAKGGAKSKQTLLYAVMDLLQQNQVQAAVVGVTSRHDAVEMLEKRVRSRFSFRRILLAPPVSDVRAVDLLKAALRLEDSSTTGSTGSTKTVPVSTTISTTNSGVPVSTGTVPVSTTGSTVTSTTTTTCPVSIFPPDPTYAVRFNQALDAALLTPAAVACITRFEQLECTPRSVGDLALVVLSRFDRNVGLITARDILYATNTLLADTYVKSLAGSSVLELCLVVAMSRLRRFRNLTNFNLNHVENELRSMAANDFLGDAGRAKGPVLLRAFEGLLAMGMCECQNAGGGQGGSHIGTGNRPGNRPGAAGVHKHFRGITLLVTDEEVDVAVRSHPQKPAGLTELLTHEGVRAATGF